MHTLSRSSIPADRHGVTEINQTHVPILDLLALSLQWLWFHGGPSNHHCCPHSPSAYMAKMVLQMTSRSLCPRVHFFECAVSMVLKAMPVGEMVTLYKRIQSIDIPLDPNS